MNKIVHTFASACMIVTCVGFETEATAQAVPPSIDPASIVNSVRQSLPPSEPAPKTQLHDANPEPTSSISTGSGPQVLLKQVNLTGTTHAVPKKVVAVYQPLIGLRVTFGAIQKMAADMQAAYRSEGQFLVQVILPPQELDPDNGVVEVRIVEGQIEKVRFREALPHALNSQLERYAKSVEAEDPINYATVDRFLLLTNELPGLQASATLAPSPDVTGGSDLLMTTKLSRWSAFGNVNNYGSKYVGPNQLTLGIAFFDLLTADSLSITGATAPNHTSELGYGNIDYGVILGNDATKVDASATTARTQPANALSTFELEGKSTQYSLTIHQPLIVSTSHRLTLFTSITHLESHNDVFGVQRLYEDAITPLTLGVNYQGVLAHAFSDVALSLTKGLLALGTPNVLSNASVAGATPSYWRVNLQSTTIRYISTRASIAFATDFQFSNDRLVSSERLSFGGPQFGQAYSFNVIAGDSGAFGSLALRYDLPLYAHLSQLQPEMFYDIGKVRFNNSTAGETDNGSASSAGVAVNVLAYDHFKLRATLAKPLSLDHAAETAQGWRGFFNFTGVF